MKLWKAVTLLLLVLVLTCPNALGQGKGKGRGKSRARGASAPATEEVKDARGKPEKAEKHSAKPRERGKKQDDTEDNESGKRVIRSGKGKRNDAEVVARQMEREEHKHRKRIARLERVRDMLAEKGNEQDKISWGLF